MCKELIIVFQFHGNLFVVTMVFCHGNFVFLYTNIIENSWLFECCFQGICIISESLRIKIQSEFEKNASCSKCICFDVGSDVWRTRIPSFCGMCRFFIHDRNLCYRFLSRIYLGAVFLFIIILFQTYDEIP